MFHRLVVTAVQGTPTEHVFALEREVVLVGRRPGVDVLLPHPAVGGVHLRLERDDTRVIAIDAGAKSGTRRRGQPLRAGERIPLEDGDELEIAGVFRARFQARASSAALPTVHQTTHELARTMVHELLGRGESAHLAVRAGPAAGGRFSLPPPGKDLLIGRGEHCDVVIPDDELSREHARLRRGWAATTIADLGSKNGTRLGRKRIPGGAERTLRPGDAIRLGATTLVYDDPVERYMTALDPRPRRARLLVVVASLAVIVAALVTLLLLLAS